MKAFKTSQPMGKIFMSGMRFYAFHGFYEEERKKGGEYLVDVELTTSFSPEASKYDRIEGTINYEEVYVIVKEEMDKPCKLLEHLAQNILTRLRSFPLEKCRVKVSKLAPPFSGEVDRVAIEVEK